MLEEIPGDHLVQPLVLQFLLHRWLFLALEFMYLSSTCPAVSLCSFPQCRFICLSIRCCPSSTRQWNKILPLLFQLWDVRGTNFSSLRVELPVRQVMIFQVQQKWRGVFPPCTKKKWGWGRRGKEETEQLQQLELPGSDYLATPLLRQRHVIQ